MSEICRFFGIIIAMLGDGHNPPHFHVRYGDYRCTITLSNGVDFSPERLYELGKAA